MTNLPNFAPQGYEIIRELGRNLEGGRITWLVQEISTNQKVVLKQFCFATAGSSWSGFELYEREISLLQGLNYPGIPHYLASFPTKDGFCLVQEYKNASPLALTRSFSPDEVKTIVVGILEILVYLQNRLPPVLHRDIKPENILIDEELNVYLIDFGLASLGSREISGSSVFKGTPGFIPPEQVRQTTEASDLYSLGATLICLLTGRKSTEIYELTTEDNPYHFEFKHLLPQLNKQFIIWLEKMVAPSLKDRFVNAQEALQKLKELEIIVQSKIEFSEKIITPSLITEIKKIPKKQLFLTYFTAVIAGLLISLAVDWTINLQIIRYAILSLALPLCLPLFGNVFMFLYFSKEMSWGGTTIGAIIGAALGAVFGAGFGVMFANGLMGDISTALGAIVGTIFGTTIGPILWFVAKDEIQSLLEEFLSRGFSKFLALTSLLLTIICGLASGTGLIVGLLNPWILGTLGATSLPLSATLWYPNWQQTRLLRKYLEREEISS